MSKTVPQKDTGQTIIIGQNRWGRGDTIADAKLEFRRQGAKLYLGYTVVTLDEQTTFEGVDQMGYLHYDGNQPIRVLTIPSSR